MQTADGRKRAVASILVGVVLAVSSLAIGMRSAARQDKLFQIFQTVKDLILRPGDPLPVVQGAVQINEFGQLAGYPGKMEVERPELGSKAIVAFVFGQSNAGNHGGQRYAAGSPNIYNFWNGKYYVAADPLLGSTGFAGSVWVLMANKLIKEGVADQVVLVPAGISDSSITHWRPGGRLNRMLESQLHSLRDSGLVITHFLWHQGESDNPERGGSATPLTDYEAGMKEVITLTKSHFPASRFFVAIATRCGVSNSPSQALQDIQRGLGRLDGVVVGPDTDVIGLEDRFDDCHFSQSGLDKHSNGWLDVLRVN
jgi:hypothetical protein